MSTLSACIQFICGCFIALLFSSCTSNSFFANSIRPTNNVQGTIELSDGLSPEGVLVWFKVFNLNTQCDENGKFSLGIPNSANQSGGGLDGIYTVYFYMANYRIDSIRVVLASGQIKLGNLDNDQNGEIDRTILLANILQVEARVGKPVLTIPQDRKQTINFTLTAPQENVKVSITTSRPLRRGVPPSLHGYIRDRSKNICIPVFNRDQPSTTSFLEVGVNKVEISPMEILLETGILQVGDFQVLPALTIEQDGIPQGLLQALKDAVGPDACDAAFQIPIAVRHNTFSVRQ